LKLVDGMYKTCTELKLSHKRRRCTEEFHAKKVAKDKATYSGTVER
jgi:hypothetical protein